MSTVAEPQGRDPFKDGGKKLLIGFLVIVVLAVGGYYLAVQNGVHF